jgi:1-acyl-sn-glycerol-3-phosphate acyltransferase
MEFPYNTYDMAKRQIDNPQIPVQLWLKLSIAVLFLRTRSFTADARSAVSEILPLCELRGLENIPEQGSCLVTCNHYTRPGLDAWWGPLLISTVVASHREPAVNAEISWVMTAAWTFPDSPWRQKVLTPVTRWAFKRIAKVYGFINMPPMPPSPNEVFDRVTAVRQTLRLAREIEPVDGMIGLAPEGRDTPDVVGSVPEGAGDFIAHLCKAGLPILPAAASELHGQMRISFGSMFQPIVPKARKERDQAVAQQVMDAIRKLAL